MTVSIHNPIFASVPKLGHAEAENEDAGAWSPGRYAIADGATEGWQAGPWASILAESFAQAAPTPAEFESWLESCRQHYSQRFPAKVTAWYAEAKQQQGAFATLLGLELFGTRRGPGWRAMAVGDCCLFRVSSGTVVERWPVEGLAEFGTRPALLGSTGAFPEPVWYAGQAKPGDLFFLLTDALAEWLFRQPEAWTVLDAALNGDFPAWVNELRRTKQLKNDDITALRVVVPAVGGVP
jgi:hypothetical protein